MIRLAVMAAFFVAGAVFVIKFLQRASSIFEIRVTKTRFVTHGKIPQRFDREMKSFLNELHLPTGAVIRAMPSQGSFRLELSNNIPQNAG